MSQENRISFQLQSGKRTLSEQYRQATPCSKRDANYNLDLLERQGQREFSSDSDLRKLAEAFREAKNWVSRASNKEVYFSWIAGGNDNV